VADSGAPGAFVAGAGMGVVIGKLHPTSILKTVKNTIPRRNIFILSSPFLLQAIMCGGQQTHDLFSRCEKVFTIGVDLNGIRDQASGIS